MKKIFICVLFLTLSFTSFCQQSKFLREDYLLKSKHQKTAAIILLSAGTALVFTALIVGSRKEASLGTAAGGVIAAGGGGVLIIASIPLFIASANNKTRGLAVSFKNETAPQFFKGNSTTLFYPAVSLRLRW